MHKFLSSFILLLTVTFFLISCENDVTEVQNLGRKNAGIEEGKNIESLLSNGGRVKAKLTAPVMLRYQLDTIKTEFPKSLHVDFFDSLATVESQLNARYGRYLENDNKVFLRDSVIVFNRKGDTLWCKELYWDQNKGTFFTDKPVRIRQTNSQFVTGQGLNADQNFRWFTIMKPGKFYNAEESFINVPDSTIQ